MAVAPTRQLDTHLAVDDAGELLVEGVAAAELAARYGTPLHVVSETRLRENYRRIRDAFAARWPGGVSVLYAIKANPALAIRRVLADEGAGGDCLGLHELRASLAAGTPGSTLVLNGNNKSDDAIRAAIRCGARINVDDLEEPERVRAIADEEGRTARVGMRVKPDLDVFADSASDMIDGSVARYTEHSKWGLEPADAVQAARSMAAMPELELTALHCHLGRHFPRPELFGLLAHALAGVLERLRAEADWSARTVAFGGGYTQGRDPFFRKPAPGEPWPRVEDSFVEPIERYADAVCDALGEELDARGLSQPVLELEPGRYIAASAGLTLATVGTVKSGAHRTWVEVDTPITHLGMSRSPRDAHAVVPARRRDDNKFVADVVGPLCVVDVIVEQAPLPVVRRGDVLAILDTGAYADGEASNANSIGRPAVVLVSHGRADLIRRRETFGDVFARDEIPPRLL